MVDRDDRAMWAGRGHDRCDAPRPTLFRRNVVARDRRPDPSILPRRSGSFNGSPMVDPTAVGGKPRCEMVAMSRAHPRTFRFGAETAAKNDPRSRPLLAPREGKTDNKVNAGPPFEQRLAGLV